MGKFHAFVLGVALGAGGYHFALCYHVVHASDGFHLVKKTTATLRDPYVDIRGFTAEQALEHPDLGAAILLSDKESLKREFAGNAVQAIADEASKLLQPPSTDQPGR